MRFQLLDGHSGSFSLASLRRGFTPMTPPALRVTTRMQVGLRIHQCSNRKKSMRFKVTLVPGVLGVPNGSTMTPGEGRNRKLNSELANGRLAAGLNGLRNKRIFVSMQLDHYYVKAN